LLDLTVEESLKRRAHRDADRFEREAQEFHERVRQGYLELAKEAPKQWCVLDASMAPDVLSKTLMRELKERKWING
jgi:dTMP kinase